MCVCLRVFENPQYVTLTWPFHCARIMRDWIEWFTLVHHTPPPLPLFLPQYLYYYPSNLYKRRSHSTATYRTVPQNPFPFKYDETEISPGDACALNAPSRLDERIQRIFVWKTSTVNRFKNYEAIVWRVISATAKVGLGWVNSQINISISVCFELLTNVFDVISVEWICGSNEFRWFISVLFRNAWFSYLA